MDYSSAVIISPFSRPLRNGKRNPKEYCWWIEVIQSLKDKGLYVIQIGAPGEIQLTDDFRPGLKLKELAELMLQCRTWIAVDNFMPHFGALNKKPGIVLWGKSDPLIFGHSQNHNLLKSRSFLRKNQFGIWEEEEYSPDVFVAPEEVISYV